MGLLEPDEKSETPEEKFLRLANARMNKVLKGIEHIGNLKAASYKHDKRTERMLTMKKALLDAVNNAIPDGETEKKDDGSFKLE